MDVVRERQRLFVLPGRSWDWLCPNISTRRLRSLVYLCQTSCWSTESPVCLWQNEHIHLLARQRVSSLYLCDAYQNNHVVWPGRLQTFRPSKHQAFNTCWFNVGPWSETVTQHYITLLSLHDALKHHFTSLKTGSILLQLAVLEGEFLWNWCSLIFKLHQLIFIHYKSRIATAIRGL